MEHIHAWRVRVLGRAGAGAEVPGRAHRWLCCRRKGSDGRWHWPIDPGSYDTAPAVRAAETAAIADLGLDSLRRLGGATWLPEGGSRSGGCCGPWMTPSPRWSHHPHRIAAGAMLDASTVMLLRCAQVGRSYLPPICSQNQSRAASRSICDAQQPMSR
jgi:hypothetical protein